MHPALLLSYMGGGPWKKVKMVSAQIGYFET